MTMVYRLSTKELSESILVSYLEYDRKRELKYLWKWLSQLHQEKLNHIFSTTHCPSPKWLTVSTTQCTMCFHHGSLQAVPLYFPMWLMVFFFFHYFQNLSTIIMIFSLGKTFLPKVPRNIEMLLHLELLSKVQRNSN